jgi:hypothetical protein
MELAGLHNHVHARDVQQGKEIENWMMGQKLHLDKVKVSKNHYHRL